MPGKKLFDQSAGPTTGKPGHIVTIEPGIYVDGVGGCRIEDLAVVRDDGVELLTSFPKELIEVR